MVDDDALAGTGAGLSGSKARWVVGAAGLAAVAVLAAVASRARHQSGERCALDGVAIDPLARVEVVDAGGRTHAFCCPRCAELWLGRQANPPRAVTVTDEGTGDRIDATRAFYVRRFDEPPATSGNRLHAFRTRAAAEEYADAVGGTVLAGDEAPFARWGTVSDRAPAGGPEEVH